MVKGLMMGLKYRPYDKLSLYYSGWKKKANEMKRNKSV